MIKSSDKGLDTLKVWQHAMAFATEICRQVLPLLPTEEKWCLSSQLRRAVQSIPANIAEGYGRYYYQDSVRFCYYARGSLEETFSHLSLAHNLAYINDERYTHLLTEIQELRRMLNGYISFLKRSKRGLTEPGSNLPIHEDPAIYSVTLEDDLSSTEP